MRVIDLFPYCSNSECPDNKKGKHKHVLPRQQEILDSQEKFVAAVGGYGSGKTLAICITAHLLCVSIPGNRGIVLRRSLPKLHDSTERIYLEVLRRSGVAFKARENRDGWPHRIIYGNGSEVTFRETKDLGRFLGPEYGWFYIDEAQEEPEKTFKDLVGRLRLPRAAQHLRGFIATNPPNNRHWIARYWPRPGAYKRTMVVRDKPVVETWRMIRSSTVENPHLDPSYVAGLIATHTPQEVQRIIHGQYGFTSEGEPVYKLFDETKHVADPKIFHMQTYRVWDFGYNQPAVLWSQIFRCKHQSLHLNVLWELEEAKLESEELAKKSIELTNRVFPPPLSNMIVDGGDTAGAQVNEKGPGPIIRLSRPRDQGGFGLRFKHQKFADIDPGLDEVRKLLREKCKCGFYLLTIHRRCKWLIEAMAGGYHYPPEKIGKEIKKPVKDGYYDNIADCLRYTVMLFYVPMRNGSSSDWYTEAMESVRSDYGDENDNWTWVGW